MKGIDKGDAHVDLLRFLTTEAGVTFLDRQLQAMVDRDLNWERKRHKLDPLNMTGGLSGLVKELADRGPSFYQMWNMD